MPLFPFFRLGRRRPPSTDDPHAPIPKAASRVTRHFYNERGFQCYASFFPFWQGWITAGHVLTDASHRWPAFAGDGDEIAWPTGLDAALKGCVLPKKRPAHPKLGQRVIAMGYPAGSRTVEKRKGHVYLERGTGSGTWIMHIETPSEPVVSGMSGGPVLDADTQRPIGILITRNSPADLDADLKPDESCDFVSLRAVWDAVHSGVGRV